MMQLDLSGRVENIPLTPANALAPLYEAIINSIHAIEDASGMKETNSSECGQIDITILRSSQMVLDSTIATAPITGFCISDNGIGLKTIISLSIHLIPAGSIQEGEKELAVFYG